MTPKSPAEIPTPEELLRRLKELKQRGDQLDASLLKLAELLLQALVSIHGQPSKPVAILLELLKKDKKLLRRWFKKVFPGLRRADLGHNALTFSFLPYFERLLEDRNQLVQKGVRDLERELSKLGYEPEAIDEAVAVLLTGEKRTSPLEACISWLERKGGGEAGTLRNAASRLRRKMLQRRAETIPYLFGAEIRELAAQGVPPITIASVKLCAFCSQRATGILGSQDGIEVRHCKNHEAPRLPINPAEGWRDCFGRIWWVKRNGIIRSKKLMVKS